MKKILLQMSAVFLSAALCLPTCFATRTDSHILQVGLAHGSGALTAANLQNSEDHGSGYRLGYFDEELEFVELACTEAEQDKITVLRASQIYYDGSAYTVEQPSGSFDTIGCYHVVLDYFDEDEYEQAKELAEEYDDAFVAWAIDEYQVRQGAYETKEEAELALEELDGWEVKGTSAYAVNVVETGDTRILFQFDGSTDTPFGVMPDVTGAEDVHTWFKGYRYRGGFRYERLDGGKLTVVNVVDMETYIKGVIPYEMNNSWPVEALKAQAVCARSYAYNCIQQRSHVSSNFDICTTECCQVYRGVGSNVENYQANERTDRAVEETAGMYALYEGEPIWAYYSSCHGGGSERIDRVWYSDFSKFPYICGVVDPYEELVADINPFSYWTKTFTASQLLERLQNNGYGKGTSIESLDLTYSEFGNVVEVQVNYENGKHNTFTPKGTAFGVRSLFGGLSSLHFTINGQKPDGMMGSASGVPAHAPELSVNEDTTLDLDEKLYVLSGSGKTSVLDPSDMYIISGDGKVTALNVEREEEPEKEAASGGMVTVSGKKFVLEGAGNGHQLGMSQFGAYAMAEEGFDYDEIVEFYYPGVRVDEL